MKKGFTLAEVLITLVVIGIVAAITIPILQQKYEKRKLYSQFMKTYSTLNQAMNMSIASGNFPSGFDFEATNGNQAKAQEFLDNYIKPYVKIIKTEQCWGLKGITVKKLSGEELGEGCVIQNIMSASDALVLTDGATVAVLGLGKASGAELIVDVNGIKGPNVYGRDIQNLKYFAKYNRPVLTGASHNVNYNGSISFDSSYYKNCCDPSASCEGTPGDSCADRLLREGKMDY